MAALNDFPSPTGSKPAGVSDSAWYGFTQVDSSKPLSWWQEQDKYYDPSATGYARYHSAKLDPSGNPYPGLVEHPDAVGDDAIQWGTGFRYKNDPAVQKFLSGGSAQPTQQSSTQPSGTNDLLSALLQAIQGKQQPQQPQGPATTGNPLQDMLLQSFGQGANMFGFNNARQENGRVGRSLANGGLLWADNGDISNWGAPPKQTSGQQPLAFGDPTEVVTATKPAGGGVKVSDQPLPGQQTKQQTPTTLWNGTVLPAGITPTTTQQQEINNAQNITQSLPKTGTDWQSWAAQNNYQTYQQPQTLANAWQQQWQQMASKGSAPKQDMLWNTNRNAQYGSY